MNVIQEVKQGNKAFIIAEIGQNHQGDINIAKHLIRIAKECGASCAKFQKTCLEEKFTKSALDAPYTGPNSWGNTYGEHKKYLEFSNKHFLELQSYATDLGLLFAASAMDPVSLKFLADIKTPFIKIGSGDSNNFLMLEQAAELNVPLIISTGMIDLSTVNNIYNLISKFHKNFALLHCVSAYPTPYEDINLKVLTEFQAKFPDIPIGYSGHETGTHISVSAVAMGAKIIERHLTLNKHQKGSDHLCSLEPQEFKMMVDQIRSLEKALGSPRKEMRDCERACFEKLGKSLVYSGNLTIGHAIVEGDFKVKVSVPKGVDARLFQELIGKVLRVHVNVDQPVNLEDFVI